MRTRQLQLLSAKVILLLALVGCSKIIIWCTRITLPEVLSLSLSRPPKKLPPHAGYHGSSIHLNPKDSFFEGWYLRFVTQKKESVALIYHIFDPHIETSRQGVGIQVITPKGTVVTNSSDTSAFRADSHNLELRNFFPGGDYFRLSDTWGSGRASSTNGQGLSVSYEFDMEPTIGWGGELSSSEQFSTAGWLAAFPVFEPHYQVLISKGNVIGGSLTLKDDDDNESTHYDLAGATMYLEKNWGGSFPSRWWWIQANTFTKHSDLCVTSTAGRRRLPLFHDEEEVGLIGIHWDHGRFLPFPDIDWEVSWGKWKVNGRYGNYRVELVGRERCRHRNGVPVLCPTSVGMEEISLETFDGTLTVSLYENETLILQDFSSEACLEVGGLPWSIKNWKGESAMKEPIKSLVLDEARERHFSRVLSIFSAFVVEIPGL